MFAVEAIADFCPFLDYWPSKNVSGDHGIKSECASLAKPNISGITRYFKREGNSSLHHRHVTHSKSSITPK